MLLSKVPRHEVVFCDSSPVNSSSKTTVSLFLFLFGVGFFFFKVLLSLAEAACVLIGAERVLCEGFLPSALFSRSPQQTWGKLKALWKAGPDVIPPSAGANERPPAPGPATHVHINSVSIASGGFLKLC